jgi:probable HAF family extracellular repeat protein
MPLNGLRLLLVGIGLLVPSSTLAQQYTVTDLGTLGGTSYYGTEALAINAAGHVVGWSPTPGGDPHPFLWTPDQGIQDLGTLPGASYCAATAINDTDHVVGHCIVGESGAFVWTPDNGMTRLDFAQSQSPIATGINNREEILVHTFNQGAFVVRNGSTKSLGYNWAWGINDAGQIVGEDVYAVMWDEAGRHDLGTMDGFGRSHAYAISATGLIVGACDDDSNFPHAAVWNGFGIENLGTLGSDFGRAQSVARAINGDIIVGSSTAANGGGVVHAVLYDHNGPGYFTDLNDLIPADSGWVLGAANGINANGQIVGNGAVNGERHAFLLTPIQSTTPR